LFGVLLLGMKFPRLGATAMLTSHIRALVLGVHLQSGLTRGLTRAATAATSPGRWGTCVLVHSKHAYSSSRLQCAPKDDVSKRPRPKDIHIPMDKVDFKYARSSGPGGQNVNKVNSKAEIRFHVQSANWLPPEVKKKGSSTDIRTPTHPHTPTPTHTLTHTHAHPHTHTYPHTHTHTLTHTHTHAHPHTHTHTHTHTHNTRFGVAYLTTKPTGSTTTVNSLQ
jgi:hypothetical protein